MADVGVVSVGSLSGSPYWDTHDTGIETYSRLGQPITFTVVGKYVKGYSDWDPVTEETAWANLYIQPVRSADLACLSALRHMALDKNCGKERN